MDATTLRTMYRNARATGHGWTEVREALRQYCAEHPIKAKATAKPTTFDGWMRAVDASVNAKAGCSVHDLPDCAFRDWFDRGMSPLAAAKRAIRECAS